MTNNLDRIKDEEAKLLSYLKLGGDLSKLNRFILRREESLGFIKRDSSGNYAVQDKAEPILSDYPLFGRYKKAKSFELHLIPFILAAVNEGYIKADESKIRTYFKSDYFTSLFTSDDNYTEAAICIVDSLRKINVIEETNSSLCLNRERASYFSDLDIYSALSYIISSDEDEKEREKLVKAIELLLRLKCVDNLDQYFNIIFNITGYDISKHVEKLLTLGIIYEDNDGLQSIEFNASAHSNAVVSSDFTLSYAGLCKEKLFFFLKPVKTDTITQWIVDKSTLRSAFSMGFVPSDVITVLQRVSLYPLPDTLISRIESWYEQFKTIQIQRALVLVTDEKNARVLDNLPLLKRHILSKAANTVFLFNPETESEWRKILSYSGYDMLTDTIGDKFAQKSENIILKSFKHLEKLPIKRAIDFDSKKYEAIINSTKSDKDKLFYSYGIFEPNDISLTEGLYYQEKLRVIQDAIAKERLLFIEDIDGNIDIVFPIGITHLEESTILMTDKRSIIIDKLWLVGMLAEYALDAINIKLDI